MIKRQSLQGAGHWADVIQIENSIAMSCLVCMSWALLLGRTQFLSR